MLELSNKVANLVNRGTICATPRTPLSAIDGAQVSFCICPCIPNMHSVIVQVFDIGIALQKPQQFVDNSFGEHFFGSKKRESFLQVKASVARGALLGAEESVTRAINLAKNGRQGDALQEWRKLFGPLFPLS